MSAWFNGAIRDPRTRCGLRVGLCAALALTGWAGGAASARAQQPERIDVLIGFDRPPGLAQEDLVRGAGGAVRYRYHLVNAIAATLPEQAMAGLLRRPGVVRIELDGRFHVIDQELNDSWGVGHIGAGVVHDSGTTGSGVLVVVIDTGIDHTHPDLDGNYAGGWDFVNDDDDPRDDNRHGTHVGGTIAAEDDGSGVVGVAPGAGLIGLKVLDQSGSGSFSDVIAALEWIVDYNATNPADAPDILITNNSYGTGSNPGTTVEQAFINSFNQGVLHVAAAGNSGNGAGRGDNVGYPAAYSSVIAVAATDASDRRSSFSSTGPAVEIAAPGVGVTSTVPGGGYASLNGTSMASPHVAGTAALVLAAGYATSPADVRQRLRDTAYDLGSAGRDNHYGFGLVDAAEAAAGSVTSDLPPDVSITSPTNGALVGGDVPITAAASDDSAVTRVEFFVDGASIGADTSSAGGWTQTWNTCQLADDSVHNLTATATDDASQSTSSAPISVTLDNSDCGAGAGITLTATGYKVKGLQKADLGWTGAAGSNVAIRRNGNSIGTTSNDGTHTDQINQKGGGTYTYQVCETPPSTVCSGLVSVVF